MQQEHEPSTRVGPAHGGSAPTTTRISGSMKYALPLFGLVAVLTLGAGFVGAFTATPATRAREKGTGMMGFVDAAVLILLVVILVPLRFARPVRRSLRNPEFRTLFLVAGATLTDGPIFYSGKEG